MRVSLCMICFFITAPFLFSVNNDVDKNVPEVVAPANNTAANVSKTEDKKIEELKDIRGYENLPLSKKAKILLITLIFIIVLFLIILFFVIKKSLKRRIEPIVELDPYDVALKAIEEAHLKHGEKYAVVLTDAVREYLSRVFQLPAPEYTTEEMVYSLSQNKIFNENLTKEIVDFLKKCDYIKFAKNVEGSEYKFALYNMAKAIVLNANEVYQKRMQAYLSENQDKS